jgi:hypothetical protein
MIHLSQFKTNLLAFFRLMVATDMGYIDIVYKGRLYRLHVEDLHQDIVKRRRPRKRDLTAEIKAQKCPQCKKLMLNGVCMNSLCEGSTKISSGIKRTTAQQTA